MPLKRDELRKLSAAKVRQATGGEMLPRTIRIGDPLWDTFKSYCRANGLTVSAGVRVLMIEKLRSEGVL